MVTASLILLLASVASAYLTPVNVVKMNLDMDRIQKCPLQPLASLPGVAVPNRFPITECGACLKLSTAANSMTVRIVATVPKGDRKTIALDEFSMDFLGPAVDVELTTCPTRPRLVRQFQKRSEVFGYIPASSSSSSASETSSTSTTEATSTNTELANGTVETEVPETSPSKAYAYGPPPTSAESAAAAETSTATETSTSTSTSTSTVTVTTTVTAGQESSNTVLGDSLGQETPEAGAGSADVGAVPLTSLESTVITSTATPAASTATPEFEDESSTSASTVPTSTESAAGTTQTEESSNVTSNETSILESLVEQLTDIFEQVLAIIGTGDTTSTSASAETSTTSAAATEATDASTTTTATSAAETTGTESAGYTVCPTSTASTTSSSTTDSSIAEPTTATTTSTTTSAAATPTESQAICPQNLPLLESIVATYNGEIYDLAKQQFQVKVTLTNELVAEEADLISELNASGNATLTAELTADLNNVQDQLQEVCEIFEGLLEQLVNLSELAALQV